MMKSLSLLLKHAAYKNHEGMNEAHEKFAISNLNRAADFGECGEGECLKLYNFGR